MDIKKQQLAHESDSDYEDELENDFPEYCFGHSDKIASIVETAKHYSLTADGICQDQERCWEGKMAAYHRQVETEQKPNNRLNRRSNTLVKIDEVFEQYWDNGVMPDEVDEKWIHDTCEHVQISMML